MDVIRWFGVVCLLLCAGLAQAGDIYTCKGAGGVNVYQNAPCPKASDELNHSAYRASMRRAADGRSDRTERGADASSMRQQEMLSDPSPSFAEMSYGGSDRATSTQGQSLPTGGLGSSAYQRGKVAGTLCIDAKGHVYYTAGRCGTSVTHAGEQEVDWRRSQVQGVPGAVMINPDQAIDPTTGQIVQLIPTARTAPTYVRTRGQGTTVSADEACYGARKAAAGRFNKKADDRVQALCRFGRSMYDQTPSGGIP